MFRGMPSLSSCTTMILVILRWSMSFHSGVDTYHHKFMSLIRKEARKRVASLWTIEPMVSSGRDSINVRIAFNKRSSKLQWIESISMTSHLTTPQGEGELRNMCVGESCPDAKPTRTFGDSVCSASDGSSTISSTSSTRKGRAISPSRLQARYNNLIEIYAQRGAERHSIDGIATPRAR